jgi:predicted DNA-binding transcriptional regulator AlpA
VKALLQNPAIDPRAVLATLPDDASVTIAEVAALVGVCPDHIGRLVASGRFVRPYRLGRVRRWALGTVRQFLRDQAASANASN